MKILWLSILSLLITGTCLPANSQTDETERSEPHKLIRADGSEVTVIVRRTSTEHKMPVVLAIAGSTCLASKYGDWIEELEPSNTVNFQFALVVVEKPGAVEPTAVNGEIRYTPDLCGDDFRYHYSIRQRTIDHLQAIQHMRQNFDWWNGELFIWGFSDGASIGAQVSALTPETNRVVLGGFGLGTNMAIDLKTMICSLENEKEMIKCEEELETQFEEIIAEPSWKKTWLDDDNTWQVWRDRITEIASNTLIDLDVPLLVFHGELDEARPISSSQIGADLLAKTDVQLEFWASRTWGMDWALVCQIVRQRLLGLRHGTGFLTYLLMKAGRHTSGNSKIVSNNDLALRAS